MKRRRLNEDGWRDVIARQRQSGQSIREFCKREGVAVSCFYLWRSRFSEASSSAPIAAKKQEPLRLRKKFIDLGELGSTAKQASINQTLELRLELGGGLVLHLTRH